MTIGVVIFTYNRPKMLAEALASALQNRPDKYLHDRLALHYRNHSLTLGNLLRNGGKNEQFKKGTME